VLLPENACANPRPGSADKPFSAMQEAVSQQVVQALDAWEW